MKILLDNKFNPWLLECNINPSLNCDTDVDIKVKSKLITDILNIIGIVPFAHDDTQEPMDKDIYHYDNLTEEIVDDCLCEFSRPRGMFELVYPLKENVNKYEKFYEKVSPESKLLWNKLLKSNGEYS